MGQPMERAEGRHRLLCWTRNTGQKEVEQVRHMGSLDMPLGHPPPYSRQPGSTHGVTSGKREQNSNSTLQSS